MVKLNVIIYKSNYWGMINKVNEVHRLIYYRMFQVEWFWLILSTSKSNYFSFEEADETGTVKGFSGVFY